MTDSAALERSYRRILACYPRSFRRDNEDEILTVLMATAEDGQRSIGLGEAADLIRGGVRMRMWPAAPRPGSVRTAVRLMLAGAAAELAFLFTVLLTSGTVKAAVMARYPGAWSGAQVHLGIDVATAPVVIGLWLWLAWANGRGQDWARMVSGACLGLMTLGMLGAMSQEAATFAPADMIAAATEWALGLASVVLIFTPAASRYYRPAVTAVQH
jgi:hypothetical protein